MSALNDLGEYAPYAAADEVTKCLHTTLHNASCALFSLYYQDDFKFYSEVRKNHNNTYRLFRINVTHYLSLEFIACLYLSYLLLYKKYNIRYKRFL